MKLTQIFSPTTLERFVKRLVSFHPFTLGWIAAFTIWELLAINDVLDESSVVAFCLAEGFFMSLVIDIWLDFLDKRRFYTISEAIAILIVVSDCWITSNAGAFDAQSNFIGHASLMTALIVACFFVPFTGSGYISRSQTYNQIKNTAVSVALGLILVFASGLLITLLRQLFNIWNIHFQSSLWFICGAVIPAIIFTGLQLRLSESGTESPIEFGGGFCKFVLLPIALIYFIILYVYLFKILIVWELPNGEITWMVTEQMVIVLITLYGLRDYYLRSDAGETNKTISDLAMRWLPLLMLPLLVLMTVGLVYRLNQYGITSSRIYVATFVIWAYAVDLYLIFYRNRANLNLVAISYAVLFVAVSAIPVCNITNITNNIIRAEIFEAFKGEELPLSFEQAKRLLGQMPEKSAQNIASKIEYLDDYSDHSLVVDIIVCDGRIYDTDLLLKTPEYEKRIYYKRGSDLIVPEGFNHFRTGSISEKDYIIDRQLLLDSDQDENPTQLNFYSNDSTKVAVINYANIYLSPESEITEISIVEATVFYNK